MILRADRLLLVALLPLTLPSPARSEAPEPRAKLKHEYPVLAVAFVSEGETLVSADREGMIRVWEVASGKEKRKFSIQDDNLLHLALSPCGRRLAATTTNGRVRVYAVATGRETHEFGGRVYPSCLAFAPDGNCLALGQPQGSICLWDLTGAQAPHVINTNLGRISSVSFGPEGKVLASGVGRERRRPGVMQAPAAAIHLWDVAKVREIRPCKLNAEQVVFAPNGKTVAAYPNDLALRLIEAATGQVRLEIAGRYSAAAFSPDSRFLALAETEDAIIHVRDAFTGKEVFELEAHEVEVSSLAFSPDGKTLASASGDFSVLLWDMSRLKGKKRLPEAKLTAAELETAWRDLAAEDPIKARAAVVLLLPSPGQSVPFVRQRLAGVNLLDPKRVAQLVADLDSNVFARRQKAGRELERLGALAEAALQQVLDGKPSLESQRRVEQLLERINHQVIPLEQVRVLRAVELLEQIGTAEARQALQELAKGAARTPFTLDAAAALKRMTR
jgi:hypothetical protein